LDGEAAGPTTSMREEPYQADVIKRYGVRAVIGKGGMGPKTLAALQEFGAVYLNGIAGGAVLRAHGRGSARRESIGIRHTGSDVALAREGLRGDRDDGRARGSLHAEVEHSTGEVAGNVAEA